MPRKAKSTAPSSHVRLNKFIADCGVTSRRKADELIENGSIKVNGHTITEFSYRVDAKKDKVTCKGKPIFVAQEKIYLMFHKPTQVLTSMGDPLGRITVADFFPKVKLRIFPVGRLDWDSEGLLLLTNDGEFAHEVGHPKKGIAKSYLVKINGDPTGAQLEKLKRGVTIVGGKVKAVEVKKLRRGSSTKYQWLRITITEGKNRQVRRMFEKIGFDVLKLRRTAIGGLSLGPLKKGEAQELTPQQLLKVFERPTAESVDH